MNNLVRNKKAFTLVEIIVAVGIFVIFAVGIYSGIQFIFKSVFQSRLRVLETGILNEQVEIVRNMPFHTIGIINGSPPGILERTVTTTRNNIDFTITRTVRNIDDPFDGTVGGNPNDTSPADYKIVDIEITCNDCGQRSPVSITTQVAPKYLEGDPSHGALFIQVFDADASPVQGAIVHIVATTTDPTFDFTDTTDNGGFLRIVDLPAGIAAYDITVIKTGGYTTEKTLFPTELIPNPVKPFASVVAQDVTSISFTIDKESSFDISTVDSLCSSVGSVPVTILGTKLIGIDPDTLLYNQTVTTDAQGAFQTSTMVWDAYAFLISNYDILGSIPSVPISLLPDINQPVQLVLGPDTAHSLVINVQDSVSNQPLSNATVTVTSIGYDETKTTGVGHIRQTDWSGSGGQEIFIDNTKYWSTDGNLDTTTNPGNITLELVGQNYVTSGNIESSIFDLGVSANYSNLVWSPFSQPLAAGSNSLRFQIATSNTSTPSTWDYKGPDGTSSSYYNEENTVIHEGHNDDQYFRYKAFLQTASSTYTPTLSDVSLPYTNSCTPPGQTYFGSLNNETYTVEVSREGYQLTNQEVTVDGDIVFLINMVSE